MNNHDNSMSSTSRRVGLYNAPTDVRMAHIAAGLKKRRAASWRLRLYGIFGIVNDIQFANFFHSLNSFINTNIYKFNSHIF